MPDFIYRPATPNDIAGMAEVRAGDWGTVERWRETMRRYLAGEHHPRHALAPRIAFVCADGDCIAGLIAGHLTHRFGCDGELQWISVRPEYRRRTGSQAAVAQAGAARGIASELLRRLAEWFVAHDARRVCVDVEPTNQRARRFYARHGAIDLKPHWMVWEDIGKGTGRSPEITDNRQAALNQCSLGTSGPFEPVQSWQTPESRRRERT